LWKSQIAGEIGLLIRRINKFDSNIILNFPEIFNCFVGKSIRLLYRGSRDGFAATDFHRCFDNISDTLTVIQTTKGSIFGGFSHCAWSSPSSGQSIFDSSHQSFVFSLVNPWNVPAKRFGITSDSSKRSICCYSGYGPVFGSGSDFAVGNPLNGYEAGWSRFGESYPNDTGIDGQKFFDGQHRFTIQNIEVFAIHD
jgi:hypothetical protein